MPKRGELSPIQEPQLPAQPQFHRRAGELVVDLRLLEIHALAFARGRLPKLAGAARRDVGFAVVRNVRVIDVPMTEPQVERELFLVPHVDPEMRLEMHTVAVLAHDRGIIDFSVRDPILHALLKVILLADAPAQIAGGNNVHKHIRRHLNIIPHAGHRRGRLRRGQRYYRKHNRTCHC
jgi:hypothetical protein